MATPFVQFASSEAAQADLFGSLGIDWKLLLVQTVAFLVLLWFLGKFVYPALSRSMDKREEDLEAANKAAIEASKLAAKSKDETERLLKKARSEAKEIVATAKTEADDMRTQAEARAREQAERTITGAQEEIAREVIAAKKALHNETVELVTLATEKVVGNVLSDSLDKKAIKDVLKETA